MADHNVQLNYTVPASQPPGPAVFRPSVNPIRVRAGQTIGFSLGQGPANGTIRVTFAEPGHFSTGNPHFHTTGRVNDGDGDVRVVSAPTGPTAYHCELLVNGQVIAQSAENAGGEVIPDT